jgi:hypothetical protein
MAARFTASPKREMGRREVLKISMMKMMAPNSHIRSPQEERKWLAKSKARREGRAVGAKN